METSQTPIKLSREEFLHAIEEKIVTKGVVDPMRMTRDVLYVLGSYLSPGEFDKVKQILPQELQTFWPDEAAA
jgi:uncharacterized protein (DUF2267 family)